MVVRDIEGVDGRRGRDVAGARAPIEGLHDIAEVTELFVDIGIRILNLKDV